MEQDLISLVVAVMDNQKAYGSLMAVSAALYGLVTLWRADWAQALLPAKLKWETWPGAIRVGFVLGLSVVAQLCATLATNAPWWSGIAPGIVAGLASMGVKSGVKAQTSEK